MVGKPVRRAPTCAWLAVMRRAHIADTLTGSRLFLAALLIPLVAGHRLDMAAVVLVTAWCTDLLDGMVARSTDHPTRLGDWDLRIDSTLGVALLVGMSAAGDTAWVPSLAVIVVLGGFTLATGNPAPVMLMLAYAYGNYLWLVWNAGGLAWWLPVIAIVVLTIIDIRRFTGVILPAFFNGIRALTRGDEVGEEAAVLDEWA